VTARTGSIEATLGAYARVLTDIAYVLASADQPEERLQRALELLRELVACENAVLLIELAPQRRLVVTAPSVDPTDRLHGHVRHLFETMGDRLIEATGIEPYSVPDARLGRSWCLAVPLVTGDAVIGVLYVCQDLEEYSVHELRLLAIAASQFAGYARGLQFLEQAQEARILAESASRAKDRFLATMSHELRTPLNVVQGWLQILRRRPASEAATQRAISVIERNVGLQVRLVDQLLDAARIATGKFDVTRQPLEMLSVVSAAVDGVRPDATAKGVELEFDVPSSSDWIIDGDAGRLQQAFANLLVNAVKFTPAGGYVRLNVKRDGSRLQITVRDTGMGIALEQLPNVFDPLWQADEASVRSKGGLGLGLSIVRHIVQIHGGEVLVESDGQDRGTTVTVRLPLKGESTVVQPDAD
jgi:signal transduction histidine kinase